MTGQEATELAEIAACPDSARVTAREACAYDVPAEGMFYVSIIDGQRVSLALGPFKHHPEALKAVPRVREYVQEREPWAAFWAFGTSRWTGDDVPPRGKLNGLGLSEGCVSR